MAIEELDLGHIAVAVWGVASKSDVGRRNEGSVIRRADNTGNWAEITRRVHGNR